MAGQISRSFKSIESIVHGSTYLPQKLPPSFGAKNFLRGATEVPCSGDGTMRKADRGWPSSDLKTGPKSPSSDVKGDFLSISKESEL